MQRSTPEGKNIRFTTGGPPIAADKRRIHCSFQRYVKSMIYLLLIYLLSFASGFIGTCASSKLKGVYNMRWKWVQELRDQKQFKTVHIETSRNLADMLTKCLSAPVREGLFKELQAVADKIETQKAIPAQ